MGLCRGMKLSIVTVEIGFWTSGKGVVKKIICRGNIVDRCSCWMEHNRLELKRQTSVDGYDPPKYCRQIPTHENTQSVRKSRPPTPMRHQDPELKRITSTDGEFYNLA